ncbi:hypothetical protein [Mangrovimonas sp. DI 80]|uniref:hypothetical protein n=1 Tax=Mangrovimonas sp. DI 80 TaxID=1779330 RepID=UPI0009772DE2|nr:hypothetical protein [Mangrovimonas sp. DI 80]OMP29689.1 hypothetical protein BKM32_16195 [Mangrovimonas sp. DI 80]
MAYLNSINLKDESGSKKTLEFIEELEDFDEILVGEGFFQWENSARILVTDEIIQKQVVPLQRQATPVKELRDEFYEFIIDLFKIPIKMEFSEELLMMDKELFGEDKRERREFASKVFLEKMSLLKPSGFEMIGHKKNASGDTVSHIQGKFEFLYYHKNGLKRALATKDMVVPYLCGDLDYFTVDLMYENSNLSDAVKFETILKILLNLNREFEFEEDHYFTKAAELKRKYEEGYKDLFTDFEFFRFVYNKITSFREYPEMYIQAFFLAMAGKGYLEESKPKSYLNFVKKEFGLELIRVLKPKEHLNRKYYERVQLLTTEIEKYEAALEGKSAF